MKPCCVVMNVLLEQHITVYKMIFVICCAIAVIVLLSSVLHRCSKNNRYFKRNSDVLHNKTNVLLCFAHPDDEVMFFSPTVMSLLGHHKKVFFLCLSTGNYDGLGNIRREEIFKSAAKLGVSHENVIILDHVGLQDGPREIWREDLVAKVVLDVVTNKNIDVIITFDSYGVSGHPNHIAVHYGVRYLMKSTDIPHGLTAYQLESTGILRKYLSFLDILFSVLSNQLIYVSDWKQWAQAIRAMQQHKSQWVWFRRLYVMFSRYMLINTLLPIDTTETEKEL